MTIIEMNAGTKLAHKLTGTKLSFADGALTMNLAKYQRDWPVTKDVMIDEDGSLAIGAGRYYAAEVEIPAIVYTETETHAEQAEGSGETGATETTRTPEPLNTDDVTLRLWSVDGIYLDI